MPWLRIDALMLLIVWYLPYWYPPRGQVAEAWLVAGTFIPISFGWAAGDVSLAAYIQSSIARLEADNTNVSALGAVMAFLYSTYIVTYAIASPLLGRYLDRVYNQTGGSNGGDIHTAIRNTAGVQFTIMMGVVLSSTFIPRGALSLNPSMLSDEALDNDLEDDSFDEGYPDGKDGRTTLQQSKIEDRMDANSRSSAEINDTYFSGRSELP